MLMGKYPDLENDISNLYYETVCYESGCIRMHTIWLTEFNGKKHIFFVCLHPCVKVAHSFLRW